MMAPFHKIVTLAVAGACLCVFGCAFPERTGYDRSIGDYKPVSEKPAQQATETIAESKPAAPQAEVRDTTRHMNSVDKARAAANKKEAAKIAQKAAPVPDFETYVKGWLGAKYVYGAASKTQTDCSGFVMQVYKGYYNIALDHSAARMYKDPRGASVSRGSLREGDLLFFGSFWNISHVGIYLSGDRFIHASSSRGVVISNLNEKYYRNKYQGARRFK